MFVRPAKEEDSENFKEWAKNTPSLDPTIFHLPETYTLCAYNEKGVTAFLPVQEPKIVSTQMLESLVINPEATNKEIASALRELVRGVILITHMKRADEVYFIGDHPETNKIAERIFTKVEYPVYRLRLKELEG